jgi:alpha-N-arabinofuranosidase
MASRTVIHVNAQEVLAEIDPNIYGHFVEHLGACAYGGIWAEEGSGIPAVHGIRSDVLKLIQDLRPANMRWPGGGFTENYHWRDGIGPRHERPMKFDWYWKKPEPNYVGTDEFIEFCRLCGAEPYICANFHTGTPEEAAGWVEYCNGDGGVKEGSWRAWNGRQHPYGVKYWSIGNETWQFKPEEYVARTVDFCVAMKRIDPTMKTVAVGLTETGSIEFDRNWNKEVISRAGSYFDYLSIHHYTSMNPRWPGTQDAERVYHSVVASPVEVGRILRGVIALLERESPSGRQIRIAFDEWNVWSVDNQGLQHNYSLGDGIYAAGVYHVLQRLSPGVGMANIAQIVNALGIIQANADSAFVTPIYLVSGLYRRECGELLLETAVQCETFDVLPTGNIPGLEKVPYIDAQGTRTVDNHRFCLTVVNRHPARPIRTELKIDDPGPVTRVTVFQVNGDNKDSMNTFDNPYAVKTVQTGLDRLPESFEFPAHSVTVLSWTCKE